MYFTFDLKFYGNHYGIRKSKATVYWGLTRGFMFLLLPNLEMCVGVLVIY